MASVLDRADAFQRRHPVIGLPLGVTYKFFDDQGNYLAAIITYYAFIAIFPMLLIASSVLGFVLQGDDELRRTVLDSALRQFPIVGTQLAQPEGLRGSTAAIVVGAITALYGMLGLGQAAQNALNVTLAVPRNSRLNPFVSRLRSLLLLLVAGLTLLVIAALALFASHTDTFGVDVARGVGWLLQIASVLLTAAVLAVLVRLSTAVSQPFRELLPGALVVALLWQALQAVGGVYVDHVVTRSESVNSVFAFVLGLLALVYLASTIAVIGMEVNVVIARRLYPRALLTPFTDAVDLTDADRRVYTEYAQAQRHKGFERVIVEFDERDDPGPPDYGGGMTDNLGEEPTAWPTHCPACGTELTSAVIDLDKTNEDRAEFNPGEMVAVDYCPNPDCPLKSEA